MLSTRRWRPLSADQPVPIVPTSRVVFGVARCLYQPITRAIHWPPFFAFFARQWLAPCEPGRGRFAFSRTAAVFARERTRPPRRPSATACGFFFAITLLRSPARPEHPADLVVVRAAPAVQRAHVGRRHQPTGALDVEPARRDGFLDHGGLDDHAGHRRTPVYGISGHGRQQPPPSSRRLPSMASRVGQTEKM